MTAKDAAKDPAEDRADAGAAAKPRDGKSRDGKPAGRSVFVPTKARPSAPAPARAAAAPSAVKAGLSASTAAPPTVSTAKAASSALAGETKSVAKSVRPADASAASGKPKSSASKSAKSVEKPLAVEGGSAAEAGKRDTILPGANPRPVETPEPPAPVASPEPEKPGRTKAPANSNSRTAETSDGNTQDEPRGGEAAPQVAAPDNETGVEREPVAVSSDPRGVLPAKPAANDVAARRRSVGGDPAAFGNASASVGEINEAVLTFVRGESEAALARMTALTQVRSPGDLVRLQVGEFRRAVDASLTCLNGILRSAGRFSGRS